MNKVPAECRYLILYEKFIKRVGMCKKSFLLIIGLLFYFPVVAQQSAMQQGMLAGIVVDSEGKGVQFANVALVQQVYQQRKIVTFATTNDEGRFSFKDIPKGNYSLQLSCMGYTDKTYDITINGTNNDLGSFVIQEGMLLDDVVISARKQVVRSEVDRLVYSVEKDTAAAKSSVLQILDKIPFVEVDERNKQIKVMGKEDGFSITVNGKKSLLLSETNQYVQEMMKAGNLKEVELITSPDGQYSSQTAVINFVTKSSLPDGLAGRISLRGSNSTSVGASVGLTSKIGRLIFELNGRYGYSDAYGSESWAKRTDYASVDYKYSDNYIRNNPGGVYYYAAGLNVSYDISALDLLTFRASISPSNNYTDVTSRTTYSDTTGMTTRELTGNSRNDNNSNHYVIGLNYQHSFKDNPARLLTFTYAYDNSSSKQTYDRLEDTLGGYTATHYANRNNTDNAEHTAGVDFYNTLSLNQSYYFTGKYVHRSYGSDAWQRDILTVPATETRLNAMDYTQQITSLQANYSYRGSKWMLTAEAALEYMYNNIAFRADTTSFAKGNYTWLASLRLTYRPTANSSFNFSLAKNQFRPDITYLNPYEDRSVPGQISVGNPNLRNADSYYASLIYRFFLNKDFNMRLIATSRYSTNMAQLYTYVNNEGLFVTTYAPNSKSLFVPLVLVAEYNPFAWLNLRLSGRWAYNRFEYPGGLNSYWDSHYSFNITANLWKGGYLHGMLDYADPDQFAANIQAKKRYMRMMGSFDFAQDFGKNFRLDVSVYNPWETYKIIKVEEAAAGFYSYREEKTLGREFYVSLTYTFGRFKESVKASRREVTNTDRSIPN